MTDNEFLLRVLKQANGWLSQDEIIRRSQFQRGHGLTVHSRAADLRKQGHMVINKMQRGSNGRAQSFYRIAA